MTQSYDLIVAGGGSGGIGAALAASRLPLQTLLVESGPMLGGTSTLGGVSNWEPSVGGTGIPFDLYLTMRQRPERVTITTPYRHFCWQEEWHWPDRLEKVVFPGGESRITPGLTYVDTLRRHPGPDRDKTRRFQQEYWHSVSFLPGALHSAAMELLAATGRCKVLLNTTIGSPEVRNGTVVSAQLSNGARVKAHYFCDATGEGALCRDCGCTQYLGIDSRDRFGEPGAPEKGSRAVNAVSLIYHIEPSAEKAVEPLPSEMPEELWWTDSPPPVAAVELPNGHFAMNTLPAMQGADYMQMTASEAYAECARRIRASWHWLQINFPEFRSWRMGWVAPRIGVRESLRTECEYMLTEHDILQGLSQQKEDDLVTIVDHALDRHGEGGGCCEVDEPYGVPYRCLLPRGFSNLAIACRAAGFSSIAASSCRLSRTMLQLGQAAGTAAALARTQTSGLPAIDPGQLREELRKQHVQLEWPLPMGLREYFRRHDPRRRKT